VTFTVQSLSTPVSLLVPHAAARSAPSLYALSVLLCDLSRSTSQHPSPLNCITLSSAFSSPMCALSDCFCDINLSTSATTLTPHLHHTHSAVHSAPSLCALSVSLCDLNHSTSQHPCLPICTRLSGAFSSPMCALIVSFCDINLRPQTSDLSYNPLPSPAPHSLSSAFSSLFVCPLLLLCDLNHSTSQHPSFLTCPHTQQRVQLPLCTPSVFCSVTSTIQPLSTPVPSLAPHSAAHSAPSLCALSVLLCDLNHSTSQHPSFLTCPTRSSAFSSLFVRPQCFAL